MACFLSSGCPNRAGSRRPVTHLAEHSARWHQGILVPPFKRPRTAGQQRGDRDGWGRHAADCSFLLHDPWTKEHQARYAYSEYGPL